MPKPFPPPWTTGFNVSYFEKLLTGLAVAMDFDPNTPFSELTSAQQKAVLHGSEHHVSVRYKNRYGRVRNWTAPFEGVLAYLKRSWRTPTLSRKKTDSLLTCARFRVLPVKARV